MRLIGDFSKLADIAARFAKISRPGLMAKVSQAMGKETLALIDEEFKTSRGPDGQLWKHPKHRNGKPMIDTRKLRASFTMKASSTGYVIKNSRRYSGFLQDGTVKMDPRKMLPENGLTNRWRLRIYGAAVKAIKAGMAK